jgi:hypothetical protein
MKNKGSVLIHEDIDRPMLVHGNYKGRRALMYQWADGTRIPVIAGGSSPVTYPNPVAHPLLAPVVTGTSISVDMMLQQPTRVTSYLADITLQRFLLDRLFTSPGGVSGGAVVYDVVQENDLYSDRDVQPVAPGAEFPVVTSHRTAPRVAEVEKYGGKFFFTDEARDRNDITAFRNEATRLGNTIVRKLNTRAVAVVDAAVAANNGFSTFVGNSWETAIPNGSNPTPPAQTPAADFAASQLLADQRELGVTYNIALVNPIQLNALRLFYANINGGLQPCPGWRVLLHRRGTARRDAARAGSRHGDLARAGEPEDLGSVVGPPGDVRQQLVRGRQGHGPVGRSVTMKIKIRHGLTRYLEPRTDGRGDTFLRTAFRGMIVEVPDDEAERLLAGPDPAAVRVDDELKKEGRISPVPTGAGAEELKAWVSVANQEDIETAVKDHPDMADRIRDARRLYETDLAAQNQLQGGVHPETGSAMTPSDLRPDGEGQGLPDDGIENLGGQESIGERVEDDDLIGGSYFSDDELDTVVQGSVEKVSEFLAEQPSLAQRVLDAETRRASAAGAKPFRAGVQEAVRVAASHASQ